MKKARIIALILAFAMCLAMLAGCSKKDDSQTTPSDDGGASASPSDTVTPSAEPSDAGEPSDDAPAGGDTGAVIKIGGIGPTTGSAANYGTAAKNGAQIAVDEINAKGGIQFELNFQDDENDAEKSVNAYNNLKDWGMQILCGTVTTTPALAVTPECSTDRIFTITPSASATAVTQGKDNVYQMCFSDPNQGSASARYISENKLSENIAVIYNNSDAYSTGIYENFAAEAKTLGLNVVSVTTFTDDTDKDFSVQLTEAKNAGADLIFLPIYYTPASLILSQAKSMDYQVNYFGCDGLDGILGIENFDASLAEGVMLLTPFSADSTDTATVSFVTEYQKRFNEVPNQFAADAYDCIYAIYQACTESGVTGDMDASAICDKLVAQFPQMSFTGLTGAGEAMTWTAAGEISKAPAAVVIKDGVYVGM